MLSHREEAAAATAVGVAVLIAWLRFGYLALLIVGLVITAFGALWLAGTVRGGLRYHQYDTMVR